MNITMEETGTSVVLENMRKLVGPYAERANASALSSCGNYLAGKLREYGDRASSSGWERMNPHSRVLRKVSKRKPYANKSRHYKAKSKRGMIVPRKSTMVKPLWRVRKAPMYEQLFDNGKGAWATAVRVGFVKRSRSIAGTMSSMATSASIRVTPKMRRYFFAIGFPLKKDTQWLHRPTRPWVQPVYAQETMAVEIRYEDKFIGALERYGVKFE